MNSTSHATVLYAFENSDNVQGKLTLKIVPRFGDCVQIEDKSYYVIGVLISYADEDYDAIIDLSLNPPFTKHY